MKEWESPPELRPVPNQDFNSDLCTCAMTRGAPRLPPSIVLPAVKNVTQYSALFSEAAIEFVKETHSQEGVFFGAICILTHPLLLNALAGGNSIVTVDKFSPLISLATRYNRIRCSIPRQSFSGNRLPNLIRRDGQLDHGLSDGVRMMGQYFGQSAPYRENETRPLMHLKKGVRLLKKGNQYVPVAAIEGSANWSRNAETSIEDIKVIDDLAYATWVYDQIAHIYSLSEGLYTFALSPTPTYEWSKKKPKRKAPGRCPDCRSSNLALRWHAKKGEPIYRVLVCTQCGEVLPKVCLKSNVPIK